MGEQIFSKDPIVPQSSKKESAACSKLAKLTSQSAEPIPPIIVALADPHSAKPTPKSAEPTFSGLVASGVSPVDLASVVVVDIVPIDLGEPSGDQDDFVAWSAIF